MVIAGFIAVYADTTNRHFPTEKAVLSLPHYHTQSECNRTATIHVMALTNEVGAKKYFRKREPRI